MAERVAGSAEEVRPRGRLAGRWGRWAGTLMPAVQGAFTLLRLFALRLLGRPF